MNKRNKKYKGLNSIIKEPNSRKIGRIHPNNYDMFIELLKDLSHENEGLRKNIPHIESLLNDMKTLKRRNFIVKHRISIAIEKLIKGMEIEEVLLEEKGKWNPIYNFLMGKKSFKAVPFFLRSLVVKIYKRIQKLDKSIMERFKETVGDVSTKHGRKLSSAEMYREQSRMYPSTTVPVRTNNSFQDIGRRGTDRIRLIYNN